MHHGKQRGLAYLIVLLMIASVGLVLASTATMWDTQRKQQQEEDLLFIGQQYMRAIASYYNSGEGSRYPQSLTALLKDPRVSYTLRHLRRVYPDPLSVGGEWGEIKAADGGVMGVYSQAPGVPLKQSGFSARLIGFEGQESYQNWIFVYRPGD